MSLVKKIPDKATPILHVFSVVAVIVGVRENCCP